MNVKCKILFVVDTHGVYHVKLLKQMWDSKCGQGYLIFVRKWRFGWHNKSCQVRKAQSIIQNRVRSMFAWYCYTLCDHCSLSLCQLLFLTVVPFLYLALATSCSSSPNCFSVLTTPSPFTVTLSDYYLPLNVIDSIYVRHYFSLEMIYGYFF